MRRIEVQRPGEKPLILVTDLLDAAAYPAEDLLWLYAERWGIEQVFQKVAEVFGLQRLIGGSPKACLFQFAFCLVLYNLIQVIRGYLAEAQHVEPDEVSTEKLFEDVEQQLIAWNVMFDPHVTLDDFASPPNLAESRTRLEQLLHSTWSERWRKSPIQTHHRKTRITGARITQSTESSKPTPAEPPNARSGRLEQKIFTALVRRPAPNGERRLRSLPLRGSCVSRNPCAR